MSRDGRSADYRSVLPVCEEFDAVLQRIIRNPENGPTAHAAAECLFAVRKLESTLTAPFNARQRWRIPRGADVHALVIPLVDKEDL